MDLWLIISLIVSVIALALSGAAFYFSIRQGKFTRRVIERQQLLSGGETLLAVKWTWSDEQRIVHCEVRATEVALHKVAVKSKREKECIDNLPAGHSKVLEFNKASKGEEWAITFVDPQGRQHKGLCEVWGDQEERFG